ncbi:MAG: phage holin family protein [Defluviitaleaceae bacterium]|nr:phage holin family protein [Defluviitaleaceae bacterium]
MYAFARCFAIAVAGLAVSIINRFFGGFDMLLQTLLLLMAVDFISGIISAVVFKCSAKTDSGKLSSRAGLQGFFKKCCCLMHITVAVHLDALLGTNTLTRDAVIIAFCINELISILENMGSMGISLPAPLLNALDVLAKK